MMAYAEEIPIPHGAFSGHLRSIEKSQTLLLNEQSRLLEKSGKEVFKFGFGQSPFPPPDAAIEALKQAAHRKEYSSVQGISPLREAAAAFHKTVLGMDITADRILVAPGSKILIYAAMAVFKHADVLIPAPAWVSYTPQTKLLGHNPIPVLTSYAARWRVTPEAVERTLKQKKSAATPTIAILNHPGNPDGLSYTPQELTALAEVFRRHNVLVISDEIYGLLHHKGEHIPFTKFYPEATIITCGISKWCGSGGWRTGIAMLPESLDGEFKEVMLGVASETYSCAPMPIQIAACAAYQWGQPIQDYLAHQRRLLSALGQWSAAELQTAGVQVYTPEGGFYLFPDFSPFAEKLKKRGVTTSPEFCAKLMADTGVALLPGDAFGMTPGHLCARLAYVDFDGSKALERSRSCGLKTPLDKGFRDEIFSKSERGIRTLCDWLSSL